eukprot:CAMPEP_0206459778 /NCGR_PEP_ID=MMETSP0324_2-20121206/24372_1 /ASSEMBLY_ACC=CAM_ASM_000836 /TAXON_ID=2866 /ORGANISM="Crypthecodinium cohnii, Strain Seligo" /LENGTH=310 /DNA_ID=CAMNT_0053931381 /DNA_START=79 /DNA_END=1011 /DNA_ORIENTATION=+
MSSRTQYLGLVACEQNGVDPELGELNLQEPSAWRFRKAIAVVAASALAIAGVAAIRGGSAPQTTLNLDQMQPTDLVRFNSDDLPVPELSGDLMAQIDKESKEAMKQMGGSPGNIRAFLGSMAHEQGQDLDAPLPALFPGKNGEKGGDDDTVPDINELLKMVHQRNKALQAAQSSGAAQAWDQGDSAMAMYKRGEVPAPTRLYEVPSPKRTLEDFEAYAKQQDQDALKQLGTEEGRAKILQMLKEATKETPSGAILKDPNYYQSQESNPMIDKLLAIAHEHNSAKNLPGSHGEAAWGTLLAALANSDSKEA